MIEGGGFTKVSMMGLQFYQDIYDGIADIKIEASTLLNIVWGFHGQEWSIFFSKSWGGFKECEFLETTSHCCF